MFLIMFFFLGDLDQGRAFIYDRNYSKAMEKFDAVLAKDPTNLEAVVGKMDAHGYQKQVTQIQSMTKSFKQGGAFEDLASAYQKIWERNFKDAESLANKHLNDGKWGYFAHYLKGYLAYLQRQYDSAINSLKVSVEKNGSFSEAYYMLGLCYQHKDDQKQLVQNWKKYLDLIPQSSRYKSVNDTLLKLGGR